MCSVGIIPKLRLNNMDDMTSQKTTLYDENWGVNWSLHQNEFRVVENVRQFSCFFLSVRQSYKLLYNTKGYKNFFYFTFPLTKKTKNYQNFDFVIDLLR